MSKRWASWDSTNLHDTHKAPRIMTGIPGMAPKLPFWTLEAIGISYIGQGPCSSLTAHLLACHPLFVALDGVSLRSRDLQRRQGESVGGGVQIQPVAT